MTYALINLPFLLAVAGAAAAAALVRSRRRRPARRSLAGRRIVLAIVVTLLGVLLLTAVFDNLIIAAGIVGYDPERISGLFVGIAPVEDFAYAIAAAVGLPALWLLLPRKRSEP